MLTLPTEYAKYVRNPAITAVIISVTDGVTTWLLGNMELDLTDGHVYGVITSDIKISQNVDEVKKTWSRCTVNVSLTNLPYKLNATTGANVRLSTLLTNSIIRKAAKIYLCNSPTITSLAECLQVFTGTTDKIGNITMKSMSLTLVDNGAWLDKKVLQNKIIDSYNRGQSLPSFETQTTGAILDENKEEFFPLVYGVYDTTKGLAKAIRVNAQNIIPELSKSITKHRYVISYKPIKSTSPVLYVPIEKKNLTEEQLRARPVLKNKIPNLQAVNTYLDTTHHFSNDCVLIHSAASTEPSKVILAEDVTLNSDRQYIFNKPQPAGYAFPHPFWGQNSEYAHDNNSSTSAIVKLSYQNTTGPIRLISQTGYIVWGINDMARVRNIIAWAANAKLSIEYIGLYATDAITSNFTDTQLSNLNTRFGLITRGEEATTNDVADGYTRWERFRTREVYTGPRTPSIITEEITSFRFPTIDPHIGLAVTYPSNTPDLTGGTYNSEMHKVEQVHCKFSAPYPSQIAPTAYVACEGHKYGSWVTSLNDRIMRFTTEDVIQDGSHIIASLINDVEGLTTADMDLPYWIASYNPFTQMRLNLTDADKTYKNVIEDLTKQMLSVFCFSAAGKAKLIPIKFATIINNYSGYNQTITWGDIKKDSFQLLKTDSANIANHLTVKTDWHEENQVFETELVYGATDSQTTYGVRKMVMEAKNINTGIGSKYTLASFMNSNHPINTLAAYLIDFRRGGTNGVLSQARTDVQFTTDGFRFAHLEVGDRITFDSTSIDPQILYGASSWAGLKFLVTDISHSPKESTFKCMLVSEAPIKGSL